MVFPAVQARQFAFIFFPSLSILLAALCRFFYVVGFVFLVVFFAVLFVVIGSDSKGPGSIFSIFSIILAGIVKVWA